MSTEPQTWPFDSPTSVACFTVWSIVDGVRPVLMASRDADDGAWQFLTGDAFDMAETVLVSLGAWLRGTRASSSLQSSRRAGWPGGKARRSLKPEAEAEQTKE